ncbi:MAG: nucleotidyltransferase domain-containing protein, partial [Thermodesulfobacteriota bacterium]|nr:nucleotidyltransferase domain-containing protein [Thermodesulfobacteriota bacterium]
MKIEGKQLKGIAFMIMRELTDNQSRIFIDTSQLYESFRDVYRKKLSYRGGMHWKKSKNKEYLFKTVDRYGNGNGLGLKTEKTEKIYHHFHSNKKQISERFKQLKIRLKEQARFCKAAKIQRVPRVVTSILRELDQRNILGNHLMVIGTNALYAYEAAAGLFFDQKITATQDMDILWDVRSKLTLAIDNKSEPENFIDILRKVDKSFDILGKQKYRVANNNGYMVDLLKTVPPNIFAKERDQIGDEDDLVAIEVMNLSWLLSAPKFSQIVIGDDGYPARMVAPDPRAFALHKFWVSQQPDRDP